MVLLRAFFALLVVVGCNLFAVSNRGFVESKSETNKALSVAVGHGLPGLDYDQANLKKILMNDAFKYDVSEIVEEDGTRKAISTKLTELAKAAGEKGTLFFYFTGHGSVGSVWAEDGDLTIEEIRGAIEKGRKNMGPLSRLVLMFDTCHAGSLLDPLKSLAFRGFDSENIQSAMIADAIFEKMTSRNDRKYWQKLMVFASSTADESSLAGSEGSVYTNAMAKAFDEVSKIKGTVGQFQKKSEEYTKGHHPMARFSPLSLVDEPLVP